VTDGLDVNYDTSGPMGISRLSLSKPVIAAVAGYAVAGGLELACWCDLRVVEEDAVFGVFCRRWGTTFLPPHLPSSSTPILHFLFLPLRASFSFHTLNSFRSTAYRWRHSTVDPIDWFVKGDGFNFNWKTCKG
jgi:hypothetical protein